MSININHSLIERMRKKAQVCQCRYRVVIAAFDKGDKLLGVCYNYPR